MPASAQLVDARGKYLMPGLWDMHVHQGSHMGCSWDVSHPLFIANGVTGVRDAYTSQLDSMRRLRREIAAGTRVGPRQILAGPALVVGTGPDLALDCGDTLRPKIQRQIALRTPAEARRVVDSLYAAGADFIKTRMSGRMDQPVLAGVPPEQALQLEREIYFAAAAEARRVGIRFEGHLPWGMVTPITAADSGHRILDHDSGHGYCYQDPRLSETSDAVRRLIGDTAGPAACRRLTWHLRRRQTWIMLGPIFGGACNEPAADSTHWGQPIVCLDSMRLLLPQNWLRLAARTGVPFLAGTDVPLAAAESGRYGPVLHSFLAKLVWLGLTPLEALQAATLNPALAYDATDSLGTVERGTLADLVLLEANPLEDIRNTTTIRAVVANGRYFDRAALDSLRVQARRAYARSLAR